MPRWMASVAASVRSLAPSFCSKLPTWTFTVTSAMPNSRAISRLVRPNTTQCSTSFSRLLSSGRAWRAASLAAMAGGK